jgi:uncharacterized protein (DUF305 family)
MKAALSLFAVIAIAASAAVQAQTPAPKAPVDHSKMDHSKMGHSAPAAGGDSASTQAFKAANDKMHAGMNIPFTGNADADFVNGMIPHHQGAVEMARIVLQHGKDPQLKKLARDIIKAQDKEIAFMQRWLAKNASATAKKP